MLLIIAKLTGLETLLGTTEGGTVRLNDSIMVSAAAEIGAAAINPLTIAAKPMTRMMGLPNETRLIDDIVDQSTANVRPLKLNALRR